MTTLERLRVQGRPTGQASGQASGYASEHAATSRTRSSRLLIRGAVFALLGAVLGCQRGPATIDVDAPRRLNGTQDVRLGAEVGVSLAPDGARLLLELESATAEPRLAVLTIADERLAPIGWTEDSREALFGVPLLTWGLACWSADSANAFARAEGGFLVADARASTPSWSPCAAAPRGLVAATRLPTSGLVAFESRDGVLEVRSSDASRRLLATHASTSPLRPRVDVVPDSASAALRGEWIAYGVFDSAGAFASRSRLYVLPLVPSGGAPIELSSDLVGVAQWSPSDNALFYLQAGEAAKRGVYVWFPPETKR